MDTIIHIVLALAIVFVYYWRKPAGTQDTPALRVEIDKLKDKLRRMEQAATEKRK